MSTGTLSPSDIETLVAPATEPEIFVDEDGYIINSQGEVIGRQDIADRFEVVDEASADWALEQRNKIEGDIAGIDARLRAVTEQLQALRRKNLARLAWWDFRFRSGIIGVARKALEGKKERSLQLTWGKVAFRKTPGKTEILDMPHAVAFVRTWEPDAVKVVESVGVKDIQKAIATASTHSGEDYSRELPFLAVSGPGESVSISTGIEIERSAK